MRGQRGLWLFLVPSGLVLTLVLLYPLGYAIYLSLFNYYLGGGERTFIEACLTRAIAVYLARHTGRRYTTPVQYLRRGPEYVVLSQHGRMWWRNIRTRPQVELLVQGRTITGRAEIADADTAPGVLRVCLEQNPRVAKFYRIQPQPGGAIDPTAIDLLLERVVVIRIHPDRVS